MTSKRPTTSLSFSELDLDDRILDALDDEGYEHPTPIQAQAIPPLLEHRDVLGCAQTGTGKTAAFALPILQHLLDDPSQKGKRVIRALVLTPTRELAAQIDESFATYGKYLNMRHQVIFGGVNEKPQIAALRKGLDILVATPGRLLDLHSRDFVDLDQVDFFVLDEADRMLDMGFIHDMKKVLRILPKERQNLLFSATMPKAIADLARSFLHEPVTVEVTPQSTTVERIEQSIYLLDRPNKRRLLVDIFREQKVGQAIVFTRTKHGANRLATQLGKAKIEAAAIHGNKSQNARRRALEGFKSGDVSVLVATDIAARGIDIDGVTHVFNYDLPNEPESYVHRIGRTGRAGREGIAISFCDASELDYLRSIEKIIGQKIPRVEEHDYPMMEEAPAKPVKAQRQGRPQRGRGRPASRGNGTGSRSRSAGRSGSGRNESPRKESSGSPRKASTGGARSASSADKPRSNRRRRRRPAAASQS